MLSSDPYFLRTEHSSPIAALCANFESSKAGGAWGSILKEYNLGCVTALVTEREKIYAIAGFVQ